MAANYPSSYPVFPVPGSGNPLNAPNHLAQHIQEDAEINAIEVELGLLPKGSDSTVRARLDRMDTAIIPKTAFGAKGDLLVGTGSGTYVSVGVGSNGQVITADSVQATGVKWATPTTGAIVTRGTFTNSSLSSGVLTITHLLGLSAPYAIIVVIYDNNNKKIGNADSETGSANSVALDLTSLGPITGTWGYAIVAG